MIDSAYKPGIQGTRETAVCITAALLPSKHPEQPITPGFVRGATHFLLSTVFLRPANRKEAPISRLEALVVSLPYPPVLQPASLILLPCGVHMHHL